MLFSIGVRMKREKELFVSPFPRVDKHFVVEADSERKAENLVKRHLKALGVEVNSVRAHPAEML
jgi:uncharacterized protein with PIN domain